MDQKLKQHLIYFESDEDEDNYVSTVSATAAAEGSNRGTNKTTTHSPNSSSNSSGSNQQQLNSAAAADRPQHKESRRKEREVEVGSRFRLLNRLPGGFPVFDDTTPDPGCEYEVHQYR